MESQSQSSMRYEEIVSGQGQHEHARDPRGEEHPSQVAPRVSESIIDLTNASPSEFEETIHSRPTMIKFYAPWCGACHKVAPVWNDLADSPPKDVQIADVDATVNVAQAQRFKVQAYPTIKLLKDGLMYDYKGRWQYDDFKRFAEDTGNTYHDRIDDNRYRDERYQGDQPFFPNDGRTQ